MSEKLIKDALFSSTVFLDETTLNPFFVPPELIFRDQVITGLTQNFRPVFKASEVGFSTNIAVVGPAGVGKTATTRFTLAKLDQLAKDLHIKLTVDYKNCWTTRSRTAILRAVLRDRFNVATRGFSDEEAMDMLTRRLTSEGCSLILALDEVSVLKQEDLRSFLHLSEEYGSHNRVSIIMISRPSEWRAILSPLVSQRVSDVISLNSYNLDETRQILEYRAQLAFRPNAFDEDLIEMVSEISHSTRNLRHGIEVLHKAGRLADRSGLNEISPELIRGAKSQIYPELRSEILEELDIHELLVLLGIARRLLHKNITATTIAKAFQNYKSICEEWEEEPKGDSSFRRHLNTIETLGLVSKVLSPVGKGKRGMRSRLTIHDVPASLIAERIESLLSQRIKSF